MRESKDRNLASAVGRRLRVGLLCLGLVIAAMASIGASAALAGAPEITLRSGAFDSVEPGNRFRFNVTAENTGTAPFTGTMTITDILPAGIVPEETQPSAESPSTCEVIGQKATCDFTVTEMNPNGQATVWISGHAEPSASGTAMNKITIEGHGAAADVEAEEAMTAGPSGPFALESFVPSLTRAGNAERQAGAAPEISETAFTFPTHASSMFKFIAIAAAPDESPRTVIVHSPPGLVANLNATPVQCTAIELTEESPEAQIPKCPTDSQVGTIHLFGKRYVAGLYNMVPPPGVPAEFGFEVAGVAVTVEAHLRPDDFGFDLVTRNVSSSVPIGDINFELWGVPADPSHDTARGVCLNGAEGNSKSVQPQGICTTVAPPKAFLRLPTSCTGPLQWSMEVDSYRHPGEFKTAAATTEPQVGCNQLEFTPTLKARPTTNVGDSPSGLEFSIHLPQNEDPEGNAEAQLKDLRAVLPEGLTVNPAGADGLGSCSPQEIGLLTPVGQVPAKFNGAHAQCPQASKLGSVSVYAPAVGRTLPGLVYLAAPHENPFGSLIALYLAVDDPVTGILVKIPVKVESDPKTGQLTTAALENAPLPFEDLKVELDPGPHAALRTPISCGSFSTSSDLTPWTTPEGEDSHPSDTFEIVKGAGGGACVSSEASAPATPSFEAGTLEPKAGAYSPFVLKLARQDGTQQLTGIDTTLPKGLIARLAGATYCPESALAAAASHSGRAEESSPSCPASSEVGSVEVAAGAGPAPLHVHGRAYLTGPYKGAPIGLAVVTPAAAGPFDLGTVVVRSALYVDPETAVVRAVSDPLPHILQGIPLDLRSVTVLLNRPNFTLSPTSCDPMSLTGSVSLLTGQAAAVSDPFQVGGCSNLTFKPKLALGLKGGTTRTAHPALTAVVRFPKAGGANVARASVALPHSEFLDQSHIRTVCTRVQFAAHECPAKSVYGIARAVTPLLDKPLEGPVFLRSSSHELPDLVAALKGQIEIDLVGRIDSKNGGIRTTFESVPDAPVTKFTLKMQGGKKGLLQNSTNICRGKHKAIALFEAQNGDALLQKPVLRARCKSGRRHHKRHSR